MSKKDDQITGAEDDAPEALKPEPPPGRVSSPDVAGDDVALRAARFGEGKEGRGARRERGVKGARAGFFERMGQFVRDTRAEMRRVSWPTGTEVKNTTIITIIAVIFFAIYLFAVDRVWAFLIEQFVALANRLTGAA